MPAEHKTSASLCILCSLSLSCPTYKLDITCRPHYAVILETKPFYTLKEAAACGGPSPDN